MYIYIYVYMYALCFWGYTCYMITGGLLHDKHPGIEMWPAQVMPPWEMRRGDRPMGPSFNEKHHGTRVPNSWLVYFMEHPTIKWMMTGRSPILGNLFFIYTEWQSLVIDHDIPLSWTNSHMCVSFFGVAEW